MDIEHYEDHLMELEEVFEESLRRTARDYPEHEDNLYIVGLDVDGQYHRVTVGVANVTDHVVTIDTGSLLRAKPRPAPEPLSAEEFGRIINGAGDEREIVDRLMEHFGVDDRVEPLHRRWHVYTVYPDIETVAPTQEQAVDNYIQACNSDDDAGKIVAEEMVPWPGGGWTIPRPGGVAAPASGE